MSVLSNSLNNLSLSDILGKVQEIKTELNLFFKERSDAINALLLSIVTKQNILLVGPPGTAKTQLARALVAHIENANFFYCLMTKFTQPDDLFGPVDIVALSKGEYRRLTNGRIQDANVAFLDEIFKASPAILNSLLTILNERLYNLDGRITPLPNLITVITASNELPEENENLDALYDRILLRVTTDYVKNPKNFVDLVLGADEYQPRTTITLDEINSLHKALSNVQLSENTIETLLKIKKELENEGIIASDRRYKQAVKVVKANALLRGARTTSVADLVVLRYILWDEPEQISTVTNIVLKHADPISQKITEIFEILNDFEKQVDQLPQGATAEALELIKKIENIIKELDQLKNDTDDPDSVNAIEELTNKGYTLKRTVLKDVIGLEI